MWSLFKAASVLTLLTLVWNGQIVFSQQSDDCAMRPGLSCSNFSDIGECNVSSGLCSCNETELGVCFKSEDNECVLNIPCYQYMEEEGECRNGRRSRTVSIILSVFLINFGAANFYIERYELAVPQIFFGLLLCFFQFGSCAVAGTKEESTSAACIVCCSINSVLSLLFLAWWIADLIIFSLNQRMDGSGCPLY